MSVVARMYSQLRQLPIFRQMIDRSRWQLSYGQFAELGARRGKRGGQHIQFSCPGFGFNSVTILRKAMVE
tara:strand:- start:1233 stop:1442 length:210 start_codon:yes stop_codon:yes gene_type:complete